nr:uncharacterized protein LOC109750266 [Aegilops tauschii subsp. strangulata]
MPDFNAHGLDPSWAEPEAERVQEFFDSLSEKYVREEPLLIQDTTKEELDYIAARAAEAALAREAGSAGHEEDEADSATEEKELAQWAESAEEASGANAEAPLVEDVDEELTEEEAEAVDPPAVGKDTSCAGLAPASRSGPAGPCSGNRDTETLAQRVAKRAKASTGDKLPAGEERQQEEPPRATHNMPPS